MYPSRYLRHCTTGIRICDRHPKKKAARLPTRRLKTVNEATKPPIKEPTYPNKRFAVKLLSGTPCRVKSLPGCSPSWSSKRRRSNQLPADADYNLLLSQTTTPG